MRRLMNTLPAMTATVFAVNAANAQEQNMPSKGQFYISPGAVVYSGPSDDDFGYDDHDTSLGLILGYGLTDNWSIEVLGSKLDARYENDFGEGEDDVELLWLDLMYKLSSRENWQPFVLFGGGRSEYQFEDQQSDVRDTQFNLGVGVFRQIHNNIAVRADVRGVTSEEGGVTTKFIIDRFNFTNAKASLDSDILGQLELNIPDIRLKDIGRKSNGATAAELAEQILKPITAAISKEAVNQGLDIEGG